MVRDSRMRSLVNHEPITPFSYRVNGLYKAYDISSVVVVGGSGDWFDVQTCTILMDNYQAQDVTKRANSISRSFCTGRVQYNGQGLVHQLPWPTSTGTNDLTNTPTQPRYINYKSLITLFGILKQSNVNNQDTNNCESSHFIMSLNNLSYYCMVKSISWSSDFKRIHFHVDDTSAAVSVNMDRDIVIDLSACDQIIACKESAMFLGFSILYCSLCLVVKYSDNKDKDMDVSSIPISDFLHVYHELIESILCVDRSDSEMSTSKKNVSDHYETLSQFVYQRLFENSNDRHLSLSLSDICHQRDANFILALNRVHGLKFSYIN